MGNLRGQGDLELLSIHDHCRDSRCQRQQRHTVAMQAVGLCQQRESGAMPGFSLDLYKVVRRIANSIKFLAEGGSYMRDVAQR